jgi:hypothetical protein
MRTKLTALLVTVAALAAGTVAHAAPIPVASYTFQGQDDVNAFQNVGTTGCKRSWVKNQALGLTVGKTGSTCAYRSSVVGDSSSAYSDQGMLATATVGGGGTKAAAKSMVGVGVRYSSSASYVLRVLPNKHKWQYFRDPKGAAPPKLESSGSGKFIKIASKPNVIALRAFSFGGTSTSVIGSVNGNNVVSLTDSSADQPDGRQTVLVSGVKGGSGTGVMGVFDNVTVQVPNPF